MEEKARLQDLLAYHILDTPPESIFDDIVALACVACNVPIALTGFMDAGREWFKAKAGIQIKELPRKEALGSHMMDLPHDILVVQDATKDERFRHSPLVTA